MSYCSVCGVEAGNYCQVGPGQGQAPRPRVGCPYWKMVKGQVVAIGKHPVHYKGYIIEEVSNPWPHCSIEYVHKDYDGPPDNRCGQCDSIQAAMEHIDELEDERSSD